MLTDRGKQQWYWVRETLLVMSRQRGKGTGKPYQINLYFLINLITIIFRVYVEDAAEYVTYLSQGTYEMKHGSAEVVMP